MPTTPGVLQTVEEVQASTVGDQVPTPAVGSLTLFSNQNGAWYSKNSAGVVTPLSPATSVSFFQGPSYMLAGQVSNATLPSYKIRAYTGQTFAIHEIDAICGTGACTVAVTRNGTNVPGLGAIAVTTADTNALPTGGDVALADGDRIAIVITSSTATDLSVTITETEFLSPV